MYAYNNTINSTHRSLIQQVKQRQMDNFDFGKIESELTAIISKSDSINTGFIALSCLSPTNSTSSSTSSSCYYDLWSTNYCNTKPQYINNTADLVHSNQLETNIPQTDINDPARAIIKKTSNQTIISTEITKQSLSGSTLASALICDKNESDIDSIELDSKSKQQQSLKKKRQLPLRSKNIDLSSYLNKNSTTQDLLCSSSSSSCSSSDTSVSPVNSPSRSNGRVNVVSTKSVLQICSFCQNNGESEEIYTSHPLKDSLSRIVCPILRNFTCPRCGESGDYAHTNKYCPHTQRKAKADKIKNALTINLS